MIFDLNYAFAEARCKKYTSVNTARLKAAALLWRDRPFCLRAVWPVYSGPAGNIASRNYIRQASEPAGCADKQRLGFAVLLRTVPAGRTAARGVARINEVDRHTAQPRLIRDKASQLR